uniref:Mini-chromosome maintenance complex-binding protein n=1 Tax=Onchocerca volvulus TaxID=6282 RepID=A0A8R1TWB1_ONCVO
MENNENQNATHSQNVTDVKLLNENDTIRSSSSKISRKNSTEDVYNEIDTIFFENVAEYTKDPCKLITKLKEKYRNEFKNWKCLHTDQVEHGDLVRMRGMILNGMQTEFSLNAVITEDEDGSTRTVCGILRNHLNCSNIKEIKDIARRNAYILVSERGITDWYLEISHGRNEQRSAEVLLENEESRIYALFYDEESENFKPNAVFDLYGIIDLAEMRDVEDDNGSNIKNLLSMVSLHVIYYELVEHHDIVRNYTNMQGFDSLIYAFEQFFESKVIALSLACQLFIFQHLQPPKSVEYTFPYTIKKVYDSKLVIEMIKLFMPKIHVIEVTQASMEKSWASYERTESAFEQGLLQVSHNTLIIIDETKISSESLLLTKKERQNYHLIKNFLSTRKMLFIYPYHTVEIESNGNDDFAMIVPNSCRKDMNFVRQYAMEHGNELNLCRHALLSCPKSFCNISICKTVEEMAVESFLTMQRIYRNANDNSARLHRQLIISKLLTSLKGKKTVDEDCWTKALELENGTLIFCEIVLNKLPSLGEDYSLDHFWSTVLCFDEFYCNRNHLVDPNSDINSLLPMKANNFGRYSTNSYSKFNAGSAFNLITIQYIPVDSK